MPPGQRRNLILNKPDPQYLLRDRFTLNKDAINRRTCEPGPGTLIMHDQPTTGSHTLVIEGGYLFQKNFGVSGTINEDVRPRLNGRAVVSRILKEINGDYRIQWGGANTNQVRFLNGTMRASGDLLTPFVATTNTTYDMVLIQRTNGEFMYARQGTSGNYTLIWVNNVSGANPIARGALSIATSALKIDYFKVINLGAPFDTTDYVIATDRKASPIANDTITQTADSLIEMTITAATGVTKELRVRWTDDNNCWIMRCDQANSTVKLIEKVAGVETERGSAAQTWTNGTQYRLVMYCTGNTIYGYVGNFSAKWIYSSASFNNTATTVKVDTAGTDLVAWPLSHDLDTLLSAGTVLLYDDFTTDRDIGSYQQVPDIGATLTINDTLAKVSTSGGKLFTNATTIPGAGDPKNVYTPHVRLCGRALMTRIKLLGNMRYMLGWNNTVNVSIQEAFGFGDSSGQQGVFVGGGATLIVLPLFALGVETDLAIVLRGSGGWLFYKDATSSIWTLGWVDANYTVSPLWPNFCARTAEFNVSLDDFRITDLPSPFNADYGIVTDRKATSLANDTILHNADALIEHTITAATGVSQELMVRWIDDNNCWIVRMSQSGSTIKLIEKVAGAETERSSVAQTWANGTSYRIKVILDTQAIRTYVANVTKNAYTSASFNQTATVAKVSHAGTDFISWPRTIGLPSV